MSTLSLDVHAHEVIDMMRDSGLLYTRETLAAAITDRFGRDTRFVTCSGHAFNAMQLVEFLASHGKFTRYAGGFTVNPAKVCAH